MNSPSLRDVVISTITPSEKIDHPKMLEPSVIDLQYMDFYTPVVFFYKAEEAHSDSSKLVDNLKESLAKVLVPYFTYAGRWVKTHDQRLRELQCYDQGVPFIEARLDDEFDTVVSTTDYTPLDSLGGFRLLGLDPSRPNQDVNFPLPALFVQVTKFKCGAVALHIACNHMTGDGQGTFAFLQAWSQIALYRETSFVPIHDRSSLPSLGDFLRPLDHTPVAVESKEITMPISFEDTNAEPAAFFISPPQESNSPLVILKSLRVRREIIENLKREAAEKNITVTTVDLITAHLWRSLNNIPESIDRKTSGRVNIAVEGRKRWQSPPLPENFAGNAVTVAYTPLIQPAELLASSHLLAATLVHDAVRAVTPANWQSYVARTLKIVETFQLEQRVITVNSWLRFPLYDIRFGCGFESPIYASSNRSCWVPPLGLACILPPSPELSEGTIATLQMVLEGSSGAVQALLSDEQFLSFFH